MRQHLHDNGIDMRSWMEVSSWEVIASFTEQGLGIGFLTDYIVGKRSLIPHDFIIPAIAYKILCHFLKK